MARKLLRQTNWGVFLLLAAALFGMVNYLAYRHYARWDVTVTKTYTLSPQTRKVLSGLPGPLDVVVFLAPNDELYDRVKDLVEAYASVTPKVKVEFIDPDRDRARMQLLAQKYSVNVANVVIFDLGGHSKYVEKDQMVDYDFSAMAMGGRPKVGAFKAEEAFTNAILDLLQPRKPVIYLSSGHGERQTGERGFGIETLKDRLRREGAEVREWQSLGRPEVPQDADCLVVAGPQKPFLPAEAEGIGTYLARGGKALFLLDPVLIQGPPPRFGTTGLESLLARWGIRPGEDLILDPATSVPSVGAQTFFAAKYGDHPVVADLAKNQYPILLSLAQSLEQTKPSDADYAVTSLLQSSTKSWGKRRLDDLDQPQSQAEGDARGPLDLALAVGSAKQDKKTRLVVVGDADVASDALMQAGAGNLLFLQNAVHWLLSDENRLAIPPKTSVETHLDLTRAEANVLFVIFLLVIPAAVAAAGVYVYLQRRR